MRRGLASLIIGLSLIVASLSWAGFTLSRTVLDPGRSERLADQLLENPDVREALTIRLADALEAQIPAEVPVPRSVIETGAEAAIDDPRVEALIRDGFVQVHRNALEGNSEPVVVDANALGAAGRDMLVEVRPELDPFLPATPAIEVELPTTGLSWMGSVKNIVDRFTGLGALVALIGAAAAFVVAKNRAPVLRRVAFWGYGASAFWLLVGYGVPWLAGSLSPTSAAIATAAADVFFGAMIRPAVVMAVAATALLLAGFALPVFERRRGGRAVQPRKARTATAVPAGAVGGATAVGAATGAPVGSPPVPGGGVGGSGVGAIPTTGMTPTARVTTNDRNDPTLVQPIPTYRTQTDPRVANTTAFDQSVPTQPAPYPAAAAPAKEPEEPRSVLWDSVEPKDPTDPMTRPTWADGR